MDVWNIDHFMALLGYLDESYVCTTCQNLMTLIADYGADIVVDSFNLAACLSARILGKPLVTILQADMHPDNRGFMWWKDPPQDIPTPVPILNALLADHGLHPVSKSNELFVGDLTLMVGTPETDPVPIGTQVTYIGAMLWQNSEATLPESVSALSSEKPVIWVYSGNPRYGPTPMYGDSIVVIRACIAALADEDVQVVLSTGHQPLPGEIASLPVQFHFAPYIPGLAMSIKSDLLIHHGGHCSCLTGLYAGTPAVIIPTFSERESNARRVAAMGAGDFIVPTENSSGEKELPAEKLRMKVKRVLSDSSFSANAKRVSQDLQRYGGVPYVASLIEDFVARGRG